MKKSAVKTVSQILKDNICTLFNLLNLLIAISLAAVGAWKNIAFIAVIFTNTVIGIVQEITAKRRIEKLMILSLPKVKVLRSGTEKVTLPDKIIQGDILILESGCAVCCDCEIVSGSAEINESVLSGESEPVLKKQGDTLLSGSSVISGKCFAKALCRPQDSFISQLTDEAKNTKSSPSEMLSSMKKVTKFTGFFIIPLGILMFLQSYFLRHTPIQNAVAFTSAGLLGMLPKGLVLLISMGLAAGVIKLSKKNVLVRELHSLENIAHCDTVCLDKTGTLTEGILSVESVFTDIDEKEFLKLMSSYLSNTDDNNSTYNALKKYFKCENPYKVISTVPFSSERKYSAVTLSDGRIFVIGAPEKLCTEIPTEAQKLMSSGKRVIFAGTCTGEITPDNITLAAMIVISDKTRKSAQDTIEYFYSQGIGVKIISGDNARSVSSIAKKVGVKCAEQCIDMSTVSEEEIENAAEKYNVFGRVTPKQKKKLVTALQKHGHKVAMTGDGVNDILAMRAADCSAAMGTGCDAAKQTAQLVLLNSDFAVLKDVISEGRRVVNNLTKSAGVFFIKTIYSVLLCLICLLFNTDFPFIPIQITLIDAVIEAFPAFFMSFERNDSKCSESFLKTALRFALPNGIAVFICCTAIFAFSKHFYIDSTQSSLLMYFCVGFISLAGVVKASLPFNFLRGFLSLSAICGFLSAVFVFSNILQLPQLSCRSASWLPIFSLLGISLAFIKIPMPKREQ